MVLVSDQFLTNILYYETTQAIFYRHFRDVFAV